eukprot:SAG31_NODE_7001_length_1823_cov_2.761601_2_plen_110_part_01
MTTVRQFVMEEEEHKKYAVSNVFRRILERRLDTTARMTWGGIDAIFVGIHVVVCFFGIKYILAGSLNTATVGMFCVLNYDNTWTIQHVLNHLLPEMIKMMEPFERVTAVL